MPTYTFTFPVEAAGLWVSVHDYLGNPVATAVLFANEGGAVASFDLPAGTYSARVAGVDGDQAMVRPDDGVPAINLSPVDPLVFGANSGGSVDAIANNALTTFDDLPPGYETGSQFALPVGLYAGYVEFDFDEPDEVRHVTIRIGGSDGTPCVFGPIAITPGTTGTTALTAYASFILTATGAVDFYVALDASVDSDVVDPADLTFGYAWASLTKIA